MSKKFIFLLILFFCLLIACVSIMIVVSDPSWFAHHEKVTGLFRQKPAPSPTAITSLTFDPPSMKIVRGQQTTIRVVLTSQNTTPRLVQLEIGYDPNALSAVIVKPGNLFVQPKTVLDIINTRIGRISYALEEAANDTTYPTTGIVALVTFTPSATFGGRETKISFFPKTMIRGKTETDKLIHTATARIIF